MVLESNPIILSFIVQARTNYAIDGRVCQIRSLNIGMLSGEQSDRHQSAEMRVVKVALNVSLGTRTRVNLCHSASGLM